MTFPNNVYLIVVASMSDDQNNTKAANYDFRFSFTDIDGEAILAEEKRIAELKANEAAAELAEIEKLRKSREVERIKLDDEV